MNWAPQPKKSKRPTRKVAAVILVVGVVIVGIGAVKVVGVAVDIFDQTRFRVPGEFTQHLDSGDWLIYRETSSSPFDLTASDVTITSSVDGKLDASDFSDGSETIDLGEDHFEAAVEFTVPNASDVTFDVRAGSRTQVLVARPLADQFGPAAGWGLLAALGLVLAILGLVFVIVPRERIDQRNAELAARAAAYPGFGGPGFPPGGGYPPGGYPPTGYPPGGYPPTGYPPTGYPPTGYPPTGYPPTGYPPTGYPPTGYPPTGYPPSGGPPGAAPGPPAGGLPGPAPGAPSGPEAANPASGSGPATPAAGDGSPVPGWYADPGGSAQARWWDGSTWTDQLR